MDRQVFLKIRVKWFGTESVLEKGSEYGGAGEWINLSESKLGKKEKEQMAVVKPYMQCEFIHAMGNGPAV